MRSPLLVSLAATSASAWPHANGVTPRGDVNPWSPPLPSDSRSPCPGLNTLANHGYLPHDGRNISVPQFAEAIHAAFNWALEVGQVSGAGAFGLLGLDPETATVDLEDLNVPNATEHRASLTRDDAEAGDPLHLNPERLQALLNDAGDADALSVASAARSRLRVQAESGPPVLTDTQAGTARQEITLLLLVMGEGPVPPPPTGEDGANADYYSGIAAPKERVRAWLEDERLPVELGWAPAERELKLADIFGVAGAILAEMEAQGEEEGGEGSLRLPESR